MADGSFVWLSDIHFDPFYPYSYSNAVDMAEITEILDKLVDRSDPAAPTWKDHTQWGAVFSASSLQGAVYSARGDDANDKVLQAVLTQAAAEAPNPDFILITGDLLGHGFGFDYSNLAPEGMNTAAAYSTFVAETLKYLALSVRRRYSSSPEPPIIATLGNNDAYCGDYDLHLDHAGSDFLADTADTFLEYFLPQLTAAEQQAFRATFGKGGYYTAPVPRGGTSRFIVLNSIPFMEKYPCESCDTCGAACGDFPLTKTSCTTGGVVDAAEQLGWLSTQAAAPGRAWVAAHVPPGIGCYDDSAYWASSDLASFRNLFLQGSSASNLAGTLAAHSHMASFKLLRDANDNAVSFVLQAPSIGSNHSNNPSFGILQHNPSTLVINSHRIWYLEPGRSGASWSHFDFAGLQGPVTAATLDALYAQLETSSTTWNTFVDDYGSRAPTCTPTQKSNCVSLGRLAQDHLGCLYDLTGLQPLAPPG